MKYLMSIAIAHDIDPNSILKAFTVKTAAVAQKHISKLKELKEGGRRVVIVDMDGCLADLRELDILVEQASGLEKERIKRNFREQTGYGSLPVIPGAVEAMLEISKKYSIVILTSRPYRKYKQIYQQTQGWLRSNGIPYDLLLFGHDKAEVVSKCVFPLDVAMAIEDKQKHAIDLSNIGIKVCILDVAGKYRAQSNYMGNSAKEMFLAGSWLDVVRILDGVANLATPG